jgi:hypothetical protein
VIVTICRRLPAPTNIKDELFIISVFLFQRPICGMEAKKRKLPEWMLVSGSTTESTKPVITPKTPVKTNARTTTPVTPSSSRITRYFSPVKKAGEEQQQVVYILSPAELEALARKILTEDD